MNKNTIIDIVYAIQVILLILIGIKVFKFIFDTIDFLIPSMTILFPFFIIIYIGAIILVKE